MEITGTLINYYIHCKRQCYLHGNRINLEDNEELVKIGKLLHEQKLKDLENTEISLENIKVDQMDEQYLIEIKKSDADMTAAKWQLYYYLKILKKYGIYKKGKLEFFEKKKGRKVIYLELDTDIERQLNQIEDEIKTLLKQEKPPTEKLRINQCKKCAYYTYCYL